MQLPSEIAWKPFPGPQTRALEAWEREIGFGGSRGPGKTEGGIHWFLDPAFIGNEKCLGLVLRKNAKDLAEWVDRVRIAYRPVNARVVGSQAPIIKFPSGCKIYTGHLKDRNSYEQYQGWNITRILIEELTQIPTEDIYERIISSNRSIVDNVPAQTFTTMNPGGPGHVWVKKRFVQKAYNKTYVVNPDKPKDRQLTRIFLPSTIDDNPILAEKDPAYIEWLNNISDEKLRKAWRYGDWDTFFGQYFDMWEPAVHVVKPFSIHQHGWNLYRAIDYGHFPGYCACGWFAIDFMGNHYMYREYYRQNRTPTQAAQDIMRMSPKNERIIATLADPSGRARHHEGKGKYDEQMTMKSTIDLFGAQGLFCIPANNDRINGWYNMKDHLVWDANMLPRLRFFENCDNAIRTIPDMLHSETIPEDMLKSGEDHPSDMVRYLLMHTVTAVPPVIPEIRDSLSGDDSYLDREEEVVEEYFDYEE